MRMKTTIQDNSSYSGFPGLLRKYSTCLIAPAAAVGLLLLTYGVFSLFPFSRQMFAWGDMVQQSIPLLLDFKRILSGQFDMFLNTANAGGMSFWGVFLFFLSSPFSFLVAFVPSKDIYLFSNILVLLKIASCTFTASLFFRRQFDRLTFPQCNALGVMYGFCGFAMLYYQNLVWLDMLCVFPILLMGLCDLTQKGKIGLYCIALSLTVIINYYLSYMVILFLILSMTVFVLFGTQKGTRRKTAALFIIGSLIAALITAIFWIPSLMQYAHSGRTVSILESLSTGRFFTNLPTTLPVILCTACIVAVLPMFFWCRLFRHRTATATFVVFLLTLIPVIIEPINKMWHTGSYQAFPVRYGYITVMMGLCLTAMLLTQGNNLQRLPDTREKTSLPMFFIIAFHIAALIAVAALLLTTRLEILSHYIHKLWMSSEALLYFLLFAGLAALVYFLLFMLYQNRMMSRRVLSIALCCTVAVEVFFSSGVFIGASARSAWSYDNALTLEEKTDPANLFRTKLNRKYFDVNLVGAMGYNSMSHYTSLTDERYIFAMKKLGYSSYWMEVGSNGGTELTDLMLANRYLITKNVETSLREDEKVYESLIYCIIENKNVRSFGIPFSAEKIEELRALPKGSRMEMQQYLSDALYDCGTVTKEYEPTDFTNTSLKKRNGMYVIEKKDDVKNGYIDYTVKVTGKQTLYFDCFDKISTALKEKINDAFDVYVNDIRVETSYPQQRSNGLVNLGSFENETVNVELKVRKDISASSFGVFGVFEAKIDKANRKKPVCGLTRSGNVIRGEVEVESDGEYLFLPLTWDKGYMVTVNGRAQKIYRVFDAFMAVKLEKGENRIVLTYQPPGFLFGAVLSGIGVILLAAALIVLRHKWIRRLSFLGWPMLILLYAAAAVVVILVYLLPVAIRIFP